MVVWPMYIVFEWICKQRLNSDIKMHEFGTSDKVVPVTNY